MLAVEVAGIGNADAHAGGDERLRDRMRLGQIADGERPAGAVPNIGAADLVLGFLEIRQHVRKTPAGIAEIAPVVIVLRLAAHVEQAVDRARPAQHFPRGCLILRFSSAGSGSVSNIQLTRASNIVRP